LLARAARAVVLVDGSKFDVVQFERVCPLSDLDAVVVETNPSRDLAAALRKAGVALTVAPA
jgi:DeoR family fructose operon transcriptional repressor